jgi:lipopolysaccharide export system protein LptC
LSSDRPQSAAAGRVRRLVWVHWLQRGLPALVGVLALVVVGQIVWRGLRAGLESRAVAQASQARMVAPTFSGQGRDGSRYVLTAASGVRDPRDADQILLEKPIVTVIRGTDTPTRTASQKGVFRQADRRLRLIGDVRIDQGSGYQFATNEAVIDTSTGQVQGQAIAGQNVGGQGALGDVKAGSYTTEDKGQRLVFKGGVRARINGR